MDNRRNYDSLTFRASPCSAEAVSILCALAAKSPRFGPRFVDKPVIIYGAGNMGRLAKDYFDRIGIKVSVVVDRNAADYSNDPFWQELEVVHPDAINSVDKNSVIIAVSVCTVPFTTLQVSLLKQGWSDIVPFYDIAEAYRNIHPLSNGWFTGPLAPDDICAIEEVFDGWVDNVSRAHHLQFLAWHSLREDWFFEDAPVTTDDRYFIPDVRLALSDDESFLDVGAHHGEVSLAFLQLVEQKFRKIWLLEPDTKNAEQLKARFADLMPPLCNQRIEVLERAVGLTCSRSKFFAGLGYASQLCDFGQQTVELLTIDSLNLAPSFIKLHLEGWELEALAGAVLTIKRTRPILAITAYHNSLGIWQLPKWLMNHLVGYRFYFRLHSWCGTGAVIYAIPGERYI
jgi:FkbM family methyltransferase